MALVKQALLELVGCQAHLKEGSISLTCVRSQINEAGDREGLSVSEVKPSKTMSPLVAVLQFPTEAQ